MFLCSRSKAGEASGAMCFCFLREGVRHGEPLCSVFGLSIDEPQDSFEMQADAITPGQTVIVIDDLIATGNLSFTLIIMFLIIPQQVVPPRLLESSLPNKADTP